MAHQEQFHINWTSRVILVFMIDIVASYVLKKKEKYI